jgi:small-conductance mechanosensitive channel
VDDLDHLLDPGSASFWYLPLAATVVIASFFVARYVRRSIRRVGGTDSCHIDPWRRYGPSDDHPPFDRRILVPVARSLIENWGAGLVLQARRPYKIGDSIESNGYVGYVEQTNLRSVVIREGNGHIVHLPNADVLKNPLVNRMGHEGCRRSAIEFKIAYDTDLPSSMQTLTQAASSVAGVEAEPAPTAWIVSLDDSAIVLELHFWHDHAQRHRVRSQVAEESLKRLTATGVSMPFPTQEVLLSGSLDLPGRTENKNPTDE